ncbi:MAG: hypothetical protein JWR48_2797 [Mycobacterium sp.]|jgi:hypothetical protein|nr:hypothetical protein [Mycobacterium sp.]
MVPHKSALVTESATEWPDALVVASSATRRRRMYAAPAEAITGTTDSAAMTTTIISMWRDTNGILPRKYPTIGRPTPHAMLPSALNVRNTGYRMADTPAATGV